MNQYPVRYAFRLDPATEAALEQIARLTFQSKASIMRRYVQEGVNKEIVLSYPLANDIRKFRTSEN